MWQRESAIGDGHLIASLHLSSPIGGWCSETMVDRSEFIASPALNVPKAEYPARCPIDAFHVKRLLERTAGIYLKPGQGNLPGFCVCIG
jgi:hypothetical protein